MKKNLSMLVVIVSMFICGACTAEVNNAIEPIEQFLQEFTEAYFNIEYDLTKNLEDYTTGDYLENLKTYATEKCFEADFLNKSYATIALSSVFSNEISLKVKDIEIEETSNDLENNTFGYSIRVNLEVKSAKTGEVHDSSQDIAVSVEKEKDIWKIYGIKFFNSNYTAE